MGFLPRAVVSGVIGELLSWDSLLGLEVTNEEPIVASEEPSSADEEL